MSDIDVQAEILDPMQRLFLPPRNMEPAQQSEALREYIKALCGFDAVDLRGAWGAVRDTHTARSWPVPAAFIMAAKQARKDRQAMAKVSSNDGAPTAPTEWDVWKRVCRSPMALEAIRRNVAWALKCAVLHDKRMPEQIDLRELVSGKASAERLASRIKDGSHPMQPGDKGLALSMWASLQQRETETQNEINYGRAA